ncbi:survival protein sure-like phosphatase/nucleotidase [Phyllosticta citrichinensis]|uniref:Survival protein sure-like phosphatase/nucleotidase n=1 Tax=Phyllosticta citrichinensis TaxID=1130410 RepID=A0ABR1XGK2_9PEZI
MQFLGLLFCVLWTLANNVAAKKKPPEPFFDAFGRTVDLELLDPKNQELAYASEEPMNTSFIDTHRRANLLLTNDDGWAEKQFRVFYDELRRYGHNVIVSAPTRDKSKKGDKWQLGKKVGKGCQYDSCGHPSKGNIGVDKKDHSLHWVEGSAFASMVEGVNSTWPQHATNQSHPKLDMVLAGPNIGHNYGYKNSKSGTTGAAVFANRVFKLPSIAFAGWNNKRSAWNVPTTTEQLAYAELAVNLTNRVLANGHPFLPEGTVLNVNFPKYRHRGQCSLGNFKFVLSRVNYRVPSLTPEEDDIKICGSSVLPTECAVVSRKEENTCYVSVTPMASWTKRSAGTLEQAAVLGQLEGFLSCLPAQSGLKKWGTNLGCLLRIWDRW